MPYVKNTADRKKALGQALLLQLFLYLTENLIITAIPKGSLQVIFSVPLTLAVFIVPILLYRYKTGYTPFLSPLFPESSASNSKTCGNIGKIFLFIFALSLTVTAVNIFGLLGDGILKLFGMHRTPASPTSDVLLLILTFIRSVLIAAFCEEMLFRGAVLNAFGKNQGMKTAVISAGLFALMHYNAAQMLYAFAAGVVISLFALKTTSLLFAFFLHFGTNLTTFVFTLLQVYLPSDLYNKISVIASLCFAIISIAGAFIYIAYNRKNTNRPQNIKAAVSVPLCPEIAAYAILALILSILNFR